MGEYCQDCGQHFLDGRLGIGLLARNTMEHLADRGLLRTVREMATDPGGVIRRYVDGQRRRYLAPHTYLFFGAALSLLSFPLYKDAVVQMARSEIVHAAMGERGLFSPEQEAAYLEALVFLTQQTAATGLLMCIPFALLLRLVFRGSGINFAEALVFSFFAFGQAMVVQSLLTPLVVLTTHDANASVWAAQLPYVLVLSQSAAVLFGSPLRSILKVNLVLAASVVLFSAGLAIGIAAYVLLFR